MRVLNELLLTGVSGASSLFSPVQTVEHMVVASIQVKWTGTLKGDLSVQASNDVTADAARVEEWIDLTDKLSPNETAGSGMIHLKDIGYKWLRLKWSATSGTGNLTARIFAKGA